MHKFDIYKYDAVIIWIQFNNHTELATSIQVQICKN